MYWSSEIYYIVFRWPQEHHVKFPEAADDITYEKFKIACELIAEEIGDKRFVQIVLKFDTLKVFVLKLIIIYLRI
ncbi:hypothetical protein P795_14055 [Acinetobacter baumannii ZW85-1]|nr:hypothetical protein P795_14055 [Acinetobacter baumannii ZW85-1]